jgi:hypothetical protein
MRIQTRLQKEDIASSKKKKKSYMKRLEKKYKKIKIGPSTEMGSLTQHIS